MLSPGTALVWQPEATSESSVRRAGRWEEERTRRAIQPWRALQLWVTGCSSDRDRAETRHGEGAGESEPLNWDLEIITLGGASQTLAPAEPPWKPPVNKPPTLGIPFACQLTSAWTSHHVILHSFLPLRDQAVVSVTHIFPLR